MKIFSPLILGLILGISAYVPFVLFSMVFLFEGQLEYFFERTEMGKYLLGVLPIGMMVFAFFVVVETLVFLQVCKTIRRRQWFIYWPDNLLAYGLVVIVGAGLFTFLYKTYFDLFLPDFSAWNRMITPAAIELFFGCIALYYGALWFQLKTDSTGNPDHDPLTKHLAAIKQQHQNEQPLSHPADRIIANPT